MWNMKEQTADSATHTLGSNDCHKLTKKALANEKPNESANDKDQEEPASMVQSDSKKEEKEVGSASINITEADGKTEACGETSPMEYFGKIIDFYFDALLDKKTVHNFPLLIGILNRIQRSRDDTAPFSKNHHYLAFIALNRLRRRFGVCCTIILYTYIYSIFFFVCFELKQRRVVILHKSKQKMQATQMERISRKDIIARKFI
ncbi:hypothetical protein RFI_16219 [Reticulomyxa filosa]|uniref:Uncharacterized protein n=1 Tax=Reticulomyxa filosa TaxID=46433 RepID=X6N5G9_RETFI|nr:hypothetical protein RFI_16219 [Reticulomyxa filosa]|eukprot:ETO20984.1 hypothetical protein RFI_16219 [Reticulomyxa filosa]